MAGKACRPQVSKPVRRMFAIVREHKILLFRKVIRKKLRGYVFFYLLLRNMRSMKNQFINY